MASDLVVCPVEHWIYLNMTARLAHPKLLLDFISIQAGTDNLFSAPGMVVGDDDVFAHHRLDGVYLSGVFPKAQGPVFKAEPVAFAADVELVAEFSVAGGNR